MLPGWLSNFYLVRRLETDGDCLYMSAYSVARADGLQLIRQDLDIGQLFGQPVQMKQDL